MKTNFHAIFLLGTLMKPKINLFYENEHENKINVFSNNELKFNLEPRS